MKVLLRNIVSKHLVSKTKYYHTSPYRLNVGTILKPGIKDSNFYETPYSSNKIWVSTSPIPHFTLRGPILEDTKSWHVYEVKPIGRVTRGMWDDLVVDKAEIVKYEGNAKGILENAGSQGSYDKRPLREYYYKDFQDAKRTFGIDPPAKPLSEEYFREILQTEKSLRDSDLSEEEKRRLRKKSYVTNPLIYLKDYLTMSKINKGRDLAYRYGYIFKDWLQENQEDLEGKVDFDVVENEYGFDLPDLVNLPDNLWEDFYEYATSKSSIVGDTQGPSWLHMDYRSIVKNQWLIHFSKYAYDIGKNGFTMGANQLESLGYTTELREIDLPGGYNFAYDIKDFSRYGKGRGWGADSWKYGPECVVFRASGIKIDHYGDQEPQVIFWGESAKDIIYIAQTDKYTEEGIGEGWGFPYGGENLPIFDELEDAVDWAIANYSQYKKHLT